MFGVEKAHEAFRRNNVKKIKSCVTYGAFRFSRLQRCFFLLILNKNHSRICGKGAGLGLFPSDSVKSQSYDFDEIAHLNTV